MSGSRLQQTYIGVDDRSKEHPPEDHDEHDVSVGQHVAAVLVLLHLGGGGGQVIGQI